MPKRAKKLRVRPRNTDRQVRARPDAASKLTGEEGQRRSLDSLGDLDRLIASRPVARVIARMLFEHERRLAGEAGTPTRSGRGDV